MSDYRLRVAKYRARSAVFAVFANILTVDRVATKSTVTMRVTVSWGDSATLGFAEFNAAAVATPHFPAHTSVSMACIFSMDSNSPAGILLAINFELIV